jgi:hypothetical protein
MTYPGQDGGGPWQPPQGPAPGNWPQQPQPSAQYPQPGYYPQQQQPYPGQPYPGQQFPGQPPMGPGQPPFPNMQYPVGPPPRRRRTGAIVGAIVAVVVLAGGGVGTWFAFNHAANTGSASPQAAATRLVSDVSNGDLLGMVNDLPPAEAGLLRDSINGTTDQLKRLNIVKQNVSPQAVTGTSIQASGLTFDNAAAEHINDHLTITKLVSGRITLSQNLDSNVYTDTFLHSAFPSGAPASHTQTYDIAQLVQQLGHPIRIATVDVNGEWYPSLFYSIADAGLQAAHENWPASAIPDVGTSSADDAVRQFAQAALDSDLRGVIERTAPDEMAALHDVGEVLVSAAGASSPSGVQIDSAQFQDRNVAGGVDAVLTSMTLTMNGDHLQLTKSGGCYSMQDSGTGQNQRFCAADVTRQLENGSDTMAFPPALTKVINDMITGLMNNGVGIVASQVNGQWYVSPGRTVTQLALDVYGTLTPDDIAAVLRLGGQH